MKHFLFKISIILVLGAVLIAPALHQTFAQEAQVNPYDDLKISLNDIRLKYHKDMNKLFNESTKILIEKLKTEAAISIESLEAVLEIPEKDEDCFKEDKKNVSTYCVAVRATKLFMQYQEALNNRRQELFDKAPEDVEAELAKKTQAGIVTEITLRSKIIDDELTTAKKALDTTLKAYNELRLAYPLHIEYQLLIPKLQKFRDALKVIRDKVETFPSKFVDAASSNCT